MTAKKDRKQQRRAKKRRARRASQPSSEQLLLKRVKTSKHLKDAIVIKNPAGKEKMSDVIMRFAEPLKGPDDDLTPKMIQFAILVWNASLLPESERIQALKDIANLMAKDDREAKRVVQEAISTLLDHKQQCFADNKRAILDYQISETAGSLSLNVASTMDEAYGTA